MKTIITAGNDYVDIDGLACAFAYKDYLTAKNIECEIVFVGDLNESVSKTVRSWGLDYKKELDNADTNSNFVIVDCANPKIVSEFVNIKRVVEVYDHHFLDELKLWNETETKVTIELVGACATLIWEKIKNENLAPKISETSLRLLYTAIIANTLNFKSSVTTERDINAFSDLEKIVDLEKDFVVLYYQELESAMLKNPAVAIKNDTKVVDLQNQNLRISIGQIELWDSRKFVIENQKIITKTLRSFGNENWFLTSPSISEGKNYIFTKSEIIKKLLKENLNAKFNDDLGETDKLWLRKEILRKLLSV